MLIRKLKNNIIKCKMCNLEKNLSEFTKFKCRGEEAIYSRCTVCLQEYNKKYKQYKHQHYLKNKEKYNEKGKLYRETHKEQIKEYFKNHRIKNRERLIKFSREHYQKNKKRINKKSLEYINNNPMQKIKKSLRNRIIKVLRGTSKSQSTLMLLGCSIEEFKIYLEKQFYSDISWDNYGSRWHLDHIIPCANFDLTNEEEQRKCFHYTNTRPLLAEENLSKKAKIIPELVEKVLTSQNSILHGERSAIADLAATVL